MWKFLQFLPAAGRRVKLQKCIDSDLRMNKTTAGIKWLNPLERPTVLLKPNLLDSGYFKMGGDARIEV
jgi:hypothetical protein